MQLVLRQTRLSLEMYFFVESENTKSSFMILNLIGLGEAIDFMKM